jgi:hypothetical protein
MRLALCAIVFVCACGPNPEQPPPSFDGGDADGAGDPCESLGALDECGGSTTWIIDCEEAIVTLRTLREVFYCAPGTTTPICDDDSQSQKNLLVCGGSCLIESAQVQFATEQEMLAFDPATMCGDAPPPGEDGGPPPPPWPDGGLPPPPPPPWPDGGTPQDGGGGWPDAAPAP